MVRTFEMSPTDRIDPASLKREIDLTEGAWLHRHAGEHVCCQSGDGCWCEPVWVDAEFQRLHSITDMKRWLDQFYAVQ